MAPDQTRTEKLIKRYLLDSEFFTNDIYVSFLAAGEYNENYTVTGKDGTFVFRINHGSQLGIENQIEYEFKVLQALTDSGVTPKPFWYRLEPEDLNGGVMLMEYIPGRRLEYEKDHRKAAGVFAAVHGIDAESADPDGNIVRQLYPISDIAGESLGLIRRFPDHPMREERDILLAYHEKILALSGEYEQIFAEGRQCIVNTEVNSSNFLINGKTASLVDWEKAVISTPFQDLGHFLVETSTRWKGNYVFTEEEKRDFLKQYSRKGGGEGMDLDTLSRCTGIMEKTILLRALSWCFMAWYEYNHTERELRNRDTEQTINTYLKEIRCFLE